MRTAALARRAPTRAPRDGSGVDDVTGASAAKRVRARRTPVVTHKTPPCSGLPVRPRLLASCRACQTIRTVVSVAAEDRCVVVCEPRLEITRARQSLRRNIYCHNIAPPHQEFQTFAIVSTTNILCKHVNVFFFFKVYQFRAGHRVLKIIRLYQIKYLISDTNWHGNMNMKYM